MGWSQRLRRMSHITSKNGVGLRVLLGDAGQQRCTNTLTAIFYTALPRSARALLRLCSRCHSKRALLLERRHRTRPLAMPNMRHHTHTCNSKHTDTTPRVYVSRPHDPPCLLPRSPCPHRVSLDIPPPLSFKTITHGNVHLKTNTTNKHTTVQILHPLSIVGPLRSPTCVSPLLQALPSLEGTERNCITNGTSRRVSARGRTAICCGRYHKRLMTAHHRTSSWYSSGLVPVSSGPLLSRCAFSPKPRPRAAQSSSFTGPPCPQLGPATTLVVAHA